MSDQDRDMDSSLEKLRQEQLRDRRRLQSIGAWLILASGLLIVAIFILFYGLGPKRTTETIITVIGELTGLALFTMGLIKILD